jgi:hypothetical protein
VTDFENRFLFDSVPVCSTCATFYLESKRRKEAELKEEAKMSKARQNLERKALELSVKARERYSKAKERDQLNRLAAALHGHEESWTKKQRQRKAIAEAARAKQARLEMGEQDELMDSREEVEEEEEKGPLQMLQEREDVDLFTGEVILSRNFDLLTGLEITD